MMDSLKDFLPVVFGLASIVFLILVIKRSAWGDYGVLRVRRGPNAERQGKTAEKDADER